MIPRIDAAALAAGDAASLAALREAATGTGFATVYNTALGHDRVVEVIEVYRAFFKRPEAYKAAVDMARTGANRGWGAAGSEQVDPDANPDYKQFFDVGYELPRSHLLADKTFYAPNLWPEDDVFRGIITAYYVDACAVSLALLRGNYYPARPAWAGARDFGIATHTDYGCLTLLATDGSAGLEVRKRGGGWIPLSAPPGEFIINFGEMLEFWTAGEVQATPHRVVGTDAERISVPLFFNPRFDTNVAPEGQPQVLAGDHLSARFRETYVHLQRTS